MEQTSLNFPDLSNLTATSAIKQIQDGRFKPSDLIQACQDRIDQYNPQLNALITLNHQKAFDAAKEFDDLLNKGLQAPPLLGLPISIKDAFATYDMRTTASFKPMLDYQPTVDATVVSRLRAAGAIFMGKSNLPELASAPHCWSPIFGLTRNPWDLELTPGGSSGGSAVAIAAGFSLLEIGSDIGGSIRIPAAYCGIAGLRATENRIPRTGHIPHLPSEFSKTGRSVWHMLSMGVLAGSVADLHLGYSLIAGPDEKDSTVISFTKPEPLPNVECIKTTKLKIAIWDDFGTPCCPATRRGIENVINQLKAEGHDVVRAAPADFDVNLAWETFGMLGGAEIGLGIPSWQAKMGSWLSRFLPKSHAISKSFSRGLAFDLRAYNQALNNREKLISGLEEFLGGWDAVLCPVAPTLPYPAQAMPIHKLMPKIKIGDIELPYLEGTVSMAIPFSVTGSPVVVLPTGLVDGLPFGMQVIGKRWQEDSLLTVSARLEGVFGGFLEAPMFSMT